jgi:hypothetical protein
MTAGQNALDQQQTSTLSSRLATAENQSAPQVDAQLAYRRKFPDPGRFDSTEHA